MRAFNWLAAMGIMAVVAVPAAMFLRGEGDADILPKQTIAELYDLGRSGWVAGYGDKLSEPFHRFDTVIGQASASPSFDLDNPNSPWRLRVAIKPNADAGQSLATMEEGEVQTLIRQTAAKLRPEFTAMGYLVRDGSSIPTLHFAIFRSGVITPIDGLVSCGFVCPPEAFGSRPVCIRSEAPVSVAAAEVRDTVQSVRHGDAGRNQAY